VCNVQNRQKCVLDIMDTFVYVEITRRNVLQIISRFSGQFNLVMSHSIVQPRVITDNKMAAPAPQADPPIYRCGTLTDNRALVSDTHIQQSNTWSVRKVSDRIFLCEHLMDYNLARLHEPTLNLSAHA
jgi:hypothetical protein